MWKSPLRRSWKALLAQGISPPEGDQISLDVWGIERVSATPSQGYGVEAGATSLRGSHRIWRAVQTLFHICKPGAPMYEYSAEGTPVQIFCLRMESLGRPCLPLHISPQQNIWSILRARNAFSGVVYLDDVRSKWLTCEPNFDQLHLAREPPYHHVQVG